jgi:hypothetical protein
MTGSMRRLKPTSLHEALSPLYVILAAQHELPALLAPAIGAASHGPLNTQLCGLGGTRVINMNPG